MVPFLKLSFCPGTIISVLLFIDMMKGFAASDNGPPEPASEDKVRVSDIANW